MFALDHHLSKVATKNATTTAAIMPKFINIASMVDYSFFEYTVNDLILLL